AGTDDRHRAHPDAQGAGAAVRGTAGAVARSAIAVFPRRRELDLLRRETADDGKPRRRGRPFTVARCRHAGGRASATDGTSHVSVPKVLPAFDAADMAKQSPWKQPWWRPAPGDGWTLFWMLLIH